MEYGIGIIMENRHGLIPDTGSGPEVISSETSGQISSPRLSMTRMLPDDHSGCQDDVSVSPMSPCPPPVTSSPASWHWTLPRVSSCHLMSRVTTLEPPCVARAPDGQWCVIITVSLSRVTCHQKVLKSPKDARLTIICSVTSSYHNSRLNVDFSSSLTSESKSQWHKNNRLNR